jgi:hypothetical protein
MLVMKMIGVALLSSLGGYIAGVPLGVLLINTFSSNRHDRAQEAVMTGAFFVGPLVALLAGIAGVVIYSHVRRPS